MIHDQPFQYLSFLCRDYGSFSENCSFEKNVEEAKNSGNEYFDCTSNNDIKVYDDVIDDDEQEKENQLLNMFKIISSFALPYPGRGVACMSPSGKISDIAEFFRKLVGYYIESIIENIEPLQVKDNEVNVKDYLLYIMTISIYEQVYD